MRQKHYEERKMFEGDAKDTSPDFGQVVDDDDEDEPDQEEADKGTDGEAEEVTVEECDDEAVN
jgi:hypothetical protein